MKGPTCLALNSSYEPATDTRLRRAVRQVLDGNARDGARGCAYCGRKANQLKPRESMTRDHVFPKSRGGTDTWDNSVMACSKCNGAKGDKTVVEANMPLRYQPTTPTYVHLAWNIRKLTAAQRAFVTELFGPEWMRYAEK
jgi:5-methylcytosine-specific restriction endonuclease McrA